MLHYVYTDVSYKNIVWDKLEIEKYNGLSP